MQTFLHWAHFGFRYLYESTRQPCSLERNTNCHYYSFLIHHFCSIKKTIPKTTFQVQILLSQCIYIRHIRPASTYGGFMSFWLWLFECVNIFHTCSLILILATWYKLWERWRINTATGSAADQKRAIHWWFNDEPEGQTWAVEDFGKDSKWENSNYEMTGSKIRADFILNLYLNGLYVKSRLQLYLFNEGWRVAAQLRHTDIDILPASLTIGSLLSRPTRRDRVWWLRRRNSVWEETEG